MLFSSIQKKGVILEFMWKLLCHFWYHWENGNPWWTKRGASRPLLLLMPVSEVGLPVLQFAPSQTSPTAAGTHQNELYFQSKMYRSWKLNTMFSSVVPKLFELCPSLDFEWEKSIQIFPLASWWFCSISLPSPASLCVQSIWWTGWVLFQSYPYTVHCFQICCSVSIKILRYSSTSIFWEMLVLLLDFKSPIIQ